MWSQQIQYIVLRIGWINFGLMRKQSTGEKQNYKFLTTLQLLLLRHLYSTMTLRLYDSFVYLVTPLILHRCTRREWAVSFCRRKARSCMKSLDRNIRRSSISLQTKIRLYSVYIQVILPTLLYEADTWSMTVAFSWRLDEFDHLRRRL